MPFEPFPRRYIVDVEDTRATGKLTKIAAGVSTSICAVAGLLYYFGGQNQEVIQNAKEITELGLFGYFITLTFGITYLQRRSDNPGAEKENSRLINFLLRTRII